MCESLPILLFPDWMVSTLDQVKSASLGDGVCQLSLNVPQCCHDGGDCLTCPTCESTNLNWLNDHICDKELFNKECCYDFEDCELPIFNVCANEKNCTIPGLTQEEIASYMLNGVCDQPLNSSNCCFDGGACLGQPFECSSCTSFNLEKVKSYNI